MAAKGFTYCLFDVDRLRSHEDTHGLTLWINPAKKLYLANESL